MGIRDETVAVFPSDHGELLSDHGIVHPDQALSPTVRDLALRCRGSSAVEAGRGSESAALRAPTSTTGAAAADRTRPGPSAARPTNRKDDITAVTIRFFMVLLPSCGPIAIAEAQGNPAIRANAAELQQLSSVP